ncbi:MAG: sigma-70 family RNA polymerase sigma factor [Bacteroidales bacterium]|nr:sigma-70 family RNA polymerase sigma factor [Bacteroidales bacterium]
MAQADILDSLMAFQPALQLTAERLLHSEAAAEDTVQEVVIDLWEHRDQLQHVRSIEAYAMQSLKNRCISLLRKRHEISTDRIEAFDRLDDESAKAEAALIEERSAQLDAMMAKLPQHQREAVTMKYIEGASHEEMQRRLGLTSTNVYATLSRAMSALKSMIK